MRCMLAPLALALLAVSCDGRAPLADRRAGMGPDPELPAPHKQLIPIIRMTHAIGWPAGRMPRAADRRQVNAFADGLDHSRWL